MKRRKYIQSVGASFIIPFTTSRSHARTIEDSDTEPLENSSAWVKRYDEITLITVVVPEDVGSTIYFDFDTGDDEKFELFKRENLIQSDKEPAGDGMVAYDFAHQFISEETSVFADGVEIDTSFSQLQGQPSYETVTLANYIGEFSWFGMEIGGKPDGVFSCRSYFIDDEMFESVVFELYDANGEVTEYKFEVSEVEETWEGEQHTWTRLEPLSDDDALFSGDVVRKSHRRRLFALDDDGGRHRLPFIVDINDLRDE